MRIRDSGMPDEAYWESLFDVPLILSRLGVDDSLGDLAELGCGYGTFTVPVARAIRGTLHAYDVDPAMVARTQARSRGLRVVCQLRDVMEQGFGVTVDAVLLFNILHCEEPVRLLRHAAEALRPADVVREGRMTDEAGSIVYEGGHVLAIHWRHDIPTPRGPAAEIRPTPEQITAWAATAGLAPQGPAVDLPPWHYGLKFHKR